jgi:hypothetical protein
MKNEDIMEILTPYLRRNEIPAETVERLAPEIERAFVSWRNGLVADLNRMVVSWEEVMGEDNANLYSLGLRRAIDRISGTSALEQLPVLEKPDTPEDFPDA